MRSEEQVAQLGSTDQVEARSEPVPGVRGAAPMLPTCQVKVSVEKDDAPIPTGLR
jgi:hypothetical protein